MPRIWFGLNIRVSMDRGYEGGVEEPEVVVAGVGWFVVWEVDGGDEVRDEDADDTEDVLASSSACDKCFWAMMTLLSSLIPDRDAAAMIQPTIK